MKLSSLEKIMQDEVPKLLWAPWKMLESEHASMAEDLRRLEERIVSTTASIQQWIAESEGHLSGHFRAEEKAVFPYLRRHAPKLSGIIRKLAAEHEQIRRTMAACKKRPLDLEASLQFLRLMRAHVQKERRLMARPHHP